jgi:hypothetical protein
MLPLDLKIEDFSSNEKITHLPRKLTEDGSGPFGNELPYDLCYFVPWGNLAMFYANYKHPGLIRLGREICKAGRPRCEDCPLFELCPTGPVVLGVGRKS